MAQTPDHRIDSAEQARRRASARRTVWVLVAVAGMIYGYFIVKTMTNHMGAWT